MDELTIGMVGAANFGAYRRKQMRAAGCFDVVAVCDRNAEALAAAAREEQAQAYDDYEAMLAHTGLEGVVISTGADSHARLAVAAMERGLHVFVEKPLCCSIEEAETLRRTADETGRVVGLGHNHCASDPLSNLAKQYIDEGRLGTVVAFEENTSHSGGLEIKPGDWRGLAGRNPGGMLFQCGVHALHALAYIFGPVDAVQAMMRYDANGNTETADVANVLLHCRSGLVGTLNCYHTTAYCHELRIFGTKGNLYLDTHTKRAWFQARKRNEVEEREPVAVPAAPESYAYSNVLSWYNGIRQGTPVYPGLEDGIAAVLPIFAAEGSARSRVQVAIGKPDKVLTGAPAESGRVSRKTRVLHVAAAQVHSGGPIDETLKRIERQVAAAAGVGVDVILFSEGALHGYDYDMTTDWIASVAEPIDGPNCGRILEIARRYRIAILVGFFERNGDDFYNSVLVARSNEECIAERKNVLTPAELSAGLAPGPLESTVVEFNGVRCAIVICADGGIKTLHENLRARGVDYRFCPTGGGGKLADMLHEGDLSTPEGLARYSDNRPRVFKAEAILSAEECPHTGFTAANALGPAGKQTCHQGHCMIVDNQRVMRAQVPGTIVIEHMQDQMIHAKLAFEQEEAVMREPGGGAG